MNEKDDDLIRREPRMTPGLGALPGSESAGATQAEASRKTSAAASVAAADWERGLLEKLLTSTLEEQRTARRWRIFFRFAALGAFLTTLGVLAGWRTQARILFDVPPSAFNPPPKVTSSVVELVPRREPLPCNPKILTAITASAFNQRRKMLRQSLKGLAVAGKSIDALVLLQAAEIEETKRAEEVDVAGFARLARVAEEMSR
jgi:hypothetical protein